MRKHTPNDNPLWEDLFKGGSLRRVTRWGESVSYTHLTLPTIYSV